MYSNFIAAERRRIRVIWGNCLMDVSEGECSGHRTMQLLGLVGGTDEAKVSSTGSD